MSSQGLSLTGKELLSNVHLVDGGLGDFVANIVDLQSSEVHILQIMKLENFCEQHGIANRVGNSYICFQHVIL